MAFYGGLVANYFAARGLIKTRLETRIPELREVLFTPSLDFLKHPYQYSPVAFIFWAGDAIKETKRGNLDQRIGQNWLIIFGTRDDGPNTIGDSVIDAAGELIDSGISALQGWYPGGVYGQLERVAADVSPEYFPGWIWAPLQFESEIITSGDNDQ